MSYRTIKLLSPKKYQKQVVEILKDPVIIDHWEFQDKPNVICREMLVRASDTQKIMDKIESFLGPEVPDRAVGVKPISGVRAIVKEVKAIWPRNDKEERKSTSTFTGLSREELYNEVSRNASITSTYLLLVILSTIVAAIGMIHDDTAVVVGAMVIAPLLGPNLALALSTALGDFRLMLRSFYTNTAGLLIVIALGYLVGTILPTDFSSDALMRRTSVNYEGIILAICAGAAGVLSLTTGVSTVLVGVMVAVALLPPATAVGIMLGAGQYPLAGGAAMLLSVNIVCLNLSAKVVMFLKGIRPHSGHEQKMARKSMIIYVMIWTVTLAGLAALIFYSKELGIGPTE